MGSNATTKKEGTVGSLSFNVIDTSPGKQVNGTSGQVASRVSGSSVTVSKEQIKPGRKPAARAKVPFEKGYSQMDWLKLTRAHFDLADKVLLLKYVQLCCLRFLFLSSYCLNHRINKM